MPDFPIPLKLVNNISIHTASPESLGSSLTAGGAAFNATNTWPVAFLAIYVPFEIYQPTTIVKMSVNVGTTSAGNICAGLYDENGKRLATSGSTGEGLASTIQTFDITDTLLNPGLYYMAIAMSSASGTLAGWNTVSALDGEGLGVFQQATALVLPDPAVFAAYAQTFIPLISLAIKTTL